jgi:cyclohexanecarboxylate-CoA ligase
MMPLCFGSSANLVDGFEPGRALASVHRHRSTLAMTPPTMLQMMLDAPELTPELLASMRSWIVSGAPVPPALLSRAGQVMPQATLLSAYGRSENITTSICLPEDPPGKTLTTDGRPVPHVSVRVYDTDGREVPHGSEGDLGYRGPSHMLEYIRDPEETAKLFTADGYSLSGDLGWLDEDGYVRVSGRIKDIIIRGGLNISVRQIEDLLLEHPAVGRVAVVGMPDERLGERICCWIEPAAPGAELSLEDVVAFLRTKQLAVQKLPERLELLDKMPENASGKIQKKQLREMAARLVGA